LDKNKLQAEEPIQMSKVFYVTRGLSFVLLLAESLNVIS